MAHSFVPVLIRAEMMAVNGNLIDQTTLKLSNGHDLMGCVSGTGCMLAAVVGSYVGANGASVDSVGAAITAFNLAGEIAGPEAKGPGSFKTKLLDALYNLTDEQFDSMKKVE